MGFMNGFIIVDHESEAQCLINIYFSIFGHISPHSVSQVIIFLQGGSCNEYQRDWFSTRGCAQRLCMKIPRYLKPIENPKVSHRKSPT